MQKKQLAVAVSAMLVSGAAFSQQSTSADPVPSPQKIEKIEVTGSNIKRVESETVAPITVITRQDIERSGKPTIAELLRDLPQNGGGSFNETFTNSFSPGASGIALRGLSQKSTLVLVNGRRMASYGLAQNLFDTYVDLNSIPTAAIERVEILRDGASAVYGSDAIAGVVNIILRKDYTGGEIALSGGTSTEGGLNEYRLSGAFGMGNPAADKFNFMGVVDYYKRDELLLSERKFTRDQDFRNFQGGTLNRGTVAAYYAANGQPNPLGRTPLSTCPAGDRINASALNPNLVGVTCTYNTAPYLTLFPKTTRIGFLGRFSYDISPKSQIFSELSISRNESNQHFTPGAVSNGTGLLVFNPATGGVRSISNTLPVGNPNNPFSAPVNILNSFFDVGGRDTKVTSDSARALVGAKWGMGAWDWESAIGASENKARTNDYNRINAIVLEQAIASGSYNFLNPTAGSVTGKDLRLDLVRRATSKLQFADIKTSTELFQLPAGAIGFAAGLDFRREELNDTPDSNLTTGRVLGSGSTRTDGSRKTSAGYFEFSVPITKELEAQIAARYDRYSDFGSATSPKFGVKWSPSKLFLIRASTSKGFRAPTLPEASQTTALSFTTVADPLNGNRPFNIAQLSVSNPSLKPEKSKNETLGFVFEPEKDFSFGADFYKIRQNNLVLRDTNTFIIAQAIAGNPQYVGNVVRDPATTFIINTVRQVRNLGFVQTAGIDFDLRKSFNLAEWGTLVVTSNFNYTMEYKVAVTPGSNVASDFVDSNGSPLVNAIPRYKGNVGFNWDKGAWNNSLTYRYIYSYDQLAAPFQTRVGSHYDLDYSVAYVGFKKLKLTASIRNLLNNPLPFDASGGSIGIDFTQYDHRGRYITLGAAYTF